MTEYNDYRWADLRNAVGWAAECARLALPFYTGYDRDDLVAAIKLSEHAADGRKIPRRLRRAKGDGPSVSETSSGYARGAVVAAEEARLKLEAPPPNPCLAYTRTLTRTLNAAALQAIEAGAAPHEIDLAYWKWIVRDLAGVRELPDETRQAAVAAVSIGQFDLARSILAPSPLPSTRVYL